MVENQTKQSRIGTGFLIVQTQMGSGAFPVPEADVTIYDPRTAGKSGTKNFKTGPNGNTPKISLPAPSANLSRYPETQEDSYFTYNITIIKDGFRDKRFINVPVFEGQTSLQIVRMQPENGDYLKEEVVDTVESDDLQG